MGSPYLAFLLLTTNKETNYGKGKKMYLIKSLQNA